MAYNFLPVDRGQRFLLPVDMKERLPRDHFADFLVELVEAMDTSAFLAAYRADGRGGAAHHPAMMATLLIYAYCDGERSSRRIEEHCRTDVAYRYLTGGLVPDHSTIARFRDRHEKELAALTGDIEAELARVVAEALAESRRADLADGTLPGTPPDPPRQPGTLPPVVGLPKALHGKAARRARLAQTKKALDDEHAITLAAHDARLRERAIRIFATGTGIRGRKPQPPARDPDRKINDTGQLHEWEHDRDAYIADVAGCSGAW
ncbi:hypothetical protein FDG2_4301 [Candidatus Protofrankia californiensis]|uniref:Transposase InsH N-terminal domain-containing protein n=1 Tax=Candidatus Protofrankia californiensis TaxID=1839754 RepID=A0A1C3P4R5_9ACTN|nr:hypothetical protein FDG2_4301 [Candidatus Protofrankia californiensis]